MVVASDFAVETVQATAFVAAEELAPPKVLRRVLQGWSEVYDAEPWSIPLPPEIPLEFPGVILASRDGSQRLELARARANVFAVRVLGQDSLDLDETYQEFARRLADIFEQDDTAIGRLAAVITRSADVPSPAEAIAEQYFREEWLRAPLNQLEELEIHAHKIVELHAGLPVNTWMRIRTARRVETGAVETGALVLAVEQDFNTLEQDRLNRVLDRPAVENFFRAAATQLEEALLVYFPDMEREQEA